MMNPSNEQRFAVGGLVGVGHAAQGVHVEAVAHLLLPGLGRLVAPRCVQAATLVAGWWSGLVARRGGAVLVLGDRGDFECLVALLRWLVGGVPQHLLHLVLAPGVAAVPHPLPGGVVGPGAAGARNGGGVDERVDDRLDDPLARFPLLGGAAGGGLPAVVEAEAERVGGV
jgi:hypothetical protein